MKKCINCGNTFGDGYNFCVKCGIRLTDKKEVKKKYIFSFLRLIVLCIFIPLSLYFLKTFFDRELLLGFIYLILLVIYVLIFKFINKYISFEEHSHYVFSNIFSNVLYVIISFFVAACTDLFRNNLGLFLFHYAFCFGSFILNFVIDFIYFNCDQKKKLKG